MSADLFISYAREDRERVQRIADELARRGYSIWWDKGLRTGEDFHDRIEEMLDTARGVVVVWSRHSVDSEFVRDEARRGHKRRVLLPVFIDPDIEPPLGFGGIHTTDLSRWIDDPSDPAPFDQFAADVAAVLGRDGAPVPVPPPSPPRPRPAPAGSAAPRRPGLLPLAIGGATLVLGTTAVYLLNRGGEDDDVSSLVPDSAVVVGAVDSPAADPSMGPDTPSSAHRVPDPPPGYNPAAALTDRRCFLPSPRGTPIQRRRLVVTPMPYRVDTATHLLLDQHGQPVAGSPAARSGTMRGRQVIVAHYTAAPQGAGERYLRTEEAGGSLHLIIGRDGRVRQLLPFDYASLHAGRSQWRDLRNISLYSIGIGLDNLGPLARREDGWYWSNRQVPADSVVVFGGRGWHRYTSAQVRAFFEVSCALRRAYPTLEHLVGHGDVSTTRRVEPGPAFPLDTVRERLFPDR